MKKKFILNVFIFGVILNSYAQESILLWPIAGEKPGSNILYKPQDFIGTEKVYGELYISAPEGTPVLAPKDGIIRDFSYTYYTSLCSTMGFGITKNPENNFTQFDSQFRRQIASENNINAQYIALSVAISTGNGEVYWILGLRPYEYFKTGKKVKRGDTLGFTGFCYKEIPEPSLRISRDINGKVADIMSPFGLKTTFIPFKPIPVKPKIPVKEMIADFNVFRKSLEEGHPGLYDYTTRSNMNAAFNNILKNINHPMSSGQFYLLLRPILDSIRDSHTYLYNFSNEIRKNSKVKIFELPVLFGVQNDSLLIYRTLPEYSYLLRKQIVMIDNEKAEDVMRKIRFEGYNEGFIDVKREFMRLRFFFWEYKFQYHHKEGDSVTFTFSDGTKAKLVYQDVPDPKKYIPAINHNVIGAANNLEIITKDKNIVYLRIGSFGLNEMDSEYLKHIMDSLSKSKCENLIIDIRNNPGGNWSYSELFSMLANQPFTSNKLNMVKKNSRFEFLKNVHSYSGIDTITLFPDYKAIDGKEGFYQINEDLVKPNDSIYFTGKVYLLTNENSYSAATLFAALIHKYKRGIIIGRETGTCYYQMNANKFVTVNLANSRLELRMPLCKLIFDDQPDPSIPWGHGVIPDYKVNWTFEELLGNSDVILNYTLNLIRNSNCNLN